jgi:formate hydrogenlyase subunit 3/multisubunit Na+/H+ antiporter MnhD subunit
LRRKRDWPVAPGCANLFLPLEPWRVEVNLESTKTIGAVSFAAVTLAMLQSICTALLTINGIRTGIGLAALAASSIWTPVLAFHRDAIRIPMLTLAVVGALVNLAVLMWIARLRNRPEAQWRRRELTKKERRSERLQVAMAVLTLVLVGLEIWAHPIVHRLVVEHVW